MPSRRPHTNSHHGCTQCKARKVKCDQAQPACNRCTKRGQACTYKHLLSSYNPFQNYNAGLLSSQSHPPPAASSGNIHRASPRSSLFRCFRHHHSTPTTSGGLPSHKPSYCPPIPQPHLQPPGLSELGPQDQRLLYHFSETLSGSLAQYGEIFSAFNGAIVRHAMARPFVYHAMLTVSALHLAVRSSSDGGALPPLDSSLSSSQSAFDFVSPPGVPQPLTSGRRTNDGSDSTSNKYLLSALSHKDKALSCFTPVLSSIDSDTCEAALAASGLLVAAAFALPRVGGAGETADPLTLWTQIAGLIKGSMVLFRLGWRDPGRLDKHTSPRIRKLILGFMGKTEPWVEAEMSLGMVESEIQKIVETVDGEVVNEEGLVRVLKAGADRLDHVGPAPITGRKHALMDAVKKLKVCLRRVKADFNNYMTSNMWIGMVSPAFVSLVTARDPLALLLLAHWTPSLTGLQYVWWVDGWPEWLMGAIRREVGEKYVGLLEWPSKEIGLV